MLEELPARKYLEWFAFDQVEPIGGLRSDWAAAAVCAQMTNLAAMRAGGKYRARPVDFLLEYGPEKPPPVAKGEEAPQKSWQELKFIAQMWVADDAAQRKRKR